MDLNRLKIFKTLAEKKSFSMAAKQLYVTQSAVSQQMKILQDELGLKLVHKVNNSFNLTPVGKSFYQAIANPMASLESEIKKVTEGEAVRKVSIVGPYAFINHVFISKTEKIKKSLNWPINFNFNYGNSHLSNPLLKSGKVDLALVSTPLSEREVDSFCIHKDQMILVINHRLNPEGLTQGLTLPMADMSEENRLFSTWKERNYDQLKTSDFKVENLAFIEGIEGIINYVLTNPSGAVVPKHLVEDHLTQGKLINMFPDCLNYQNELWCCLLKKRKSDPELMELFDLLKKIGI